MYNIGESDMAYLRFSAVCCLLLGFISISPVAASEGLPGEYSYNYVLTGNDANANNLNPANLLFIDRPEATWLSTFLFEGTHLAYMNFSYPIRRVGTAAISMMLLYSGGMEARGDGNIDLGGEYDATDMMIYMSYAHKLGDFLYAGANLKTKIIKMSTLDEINPTQLNRIGAYSQGIDVGITYIPVRQLYVGLSIINLAHFYYNSDSDLAQDMPVALKLSVDSKMLDNKLKLGFDFDFLDIVTDLKGSDALSRGLYYNMEYAIRKWFAVRGSIDDRELGFGLKYTAKDLLKTKKGEQVEISYDTGYNHKMAAMVNRLGVTARWGLTRKQHESHRLGLVRRMAPMNAYDEAMRLFHKKMYWDAAHGFGTVVSLYPQYDRVSLATFYIAESYYHMGLYGSARELYNAIMVDYPEFSRKGDIVFRLQKMHYAENDYDKVLEMYTTISQEYAESGVADDAAYLAGQVYFKRGQHQAALAFYEQIPSTSNVYKFAQYSMAQCYLHLSDNKKIVSHFSNVLIAPGVTSAEKELINRTNLVLGHLYFELFDYNKAVSYYDKVLKGSHFFDEALIGHAWSLINLRLYPEAIDKLNKLVKEMPHSIYANEADLVKGYCYTLLKDFDRSIAEFNSMITRCKTGVDKLGVDVASVPRVLSEKEVKMTAAAQAFSELETEIRMNVLRKPSQKRDADATQQHGELDIKLGDVHGLQDDYLQYKDDVRLSEVYVKLLQNAEYALATAAHLKKEEAKKKEDKNYEDKIKKLEEKLNNQLIEKKQ